MDHLPFFFHPQGKIQTGMKFSLGAFTSGFTADPRHGNQRADEQGFLVEELIQPGAGLALFGGKIATVTHKDMGQAFFECEFAQIKQAPQSLGFTKG